MKYYPINEDLARRAKEMVSFDDYRPGTATNRYRSMVDEAAKVAEEQKKKTDPMFHEKIDELLDTYARKLADNLNQHYSIQTRCPSVMVAGGSNFPVAKKQKQNAAADRNMEEFSEIQGIVSKIKSVGMGGISADDPQAVEKLRAKLAKLEEMQATMKAVNAYYRKHGTLDGCEDVPPSVLEKLEAAMRSPWRTDPKPFPSYQLSNNNATIRSTKARIEELEKKRTEAAPEGWTFDGGEVVINTEINRLQIVFDERPDYGLKEELKRHGFRWAPSQGAWQRQLTDNAITAAKKVTGGPNVQGVDKNADL